MTTKPELLDELLDKLLDNANTAESKAELLDNAPAAEYVGVKPHTLEIWRCTGRYKIQFIRVGRRIKYRRSALDAWLASRTVNTEAAQ